MTIDKAVQAARGMQLFSQQTKRETKLASSVTIWLQLVTLKSLIIFGDYF